MDFTSFIVFIIVLFVYLHLTYQWKRSEDLEVYEMDYESNTQLQEVCDVKQPVLFDFKCVSPEFFENINLNHLLEQGTHQDICVKDCNDYNTQSCVDSIVLPLKTAYPLLKSDPASHLIAEGNEDFLEESSFIKHYQSYVDEYLKPSFTVRTTYDLCMGSKKSHTPFRYHTHSRHYCIVATGTIHVKMSPWKSAKHLHPIHDYENYEFFTNVNPWDFSEDKIKFLEFEVQEGYVLYIPQYWWYSIQYDSYDTIVCTATYNTTMNMVANMKHWILYFFQQQNIQQKTMKTLELDSHHEDDAEQDKSIDNDSPENSREDLPEDSTADIIKNLHHIGDTSLVNDNTNISM